MEFRTLEEVARFNARRRQELIGLVVSASPELRTWRPAPEKWSMQEHLEHIALITQWIAPAFEQLTGSLKQGGLTATPETARQVDCLSLLSAAGILSKKFQAPPEAVPQGRSVDEILALLDLAQARIQACVEQFPTLDTDKVTFHHPAGVSLNLAQLWHFAGLHDTLHIQHMRANLAAWEARNQAG